MKNEFNDKLKKINLLYKKQIKSIQEEVINIINNKYNSIEDQIFKLGINLNNNNLNDIIKEVEINNIIENNKNKLENINNKENKGKNIEKSFIFDGDQINIENDEKLKDYNIINKSKILINNEKKEDKKDNLIFKDNQLDKEKEENLGFNIIDKEELLKENEKKEDKIDGNNNKFNDFENMEYNNKIQNNINKVHKKISKKIHNFHPKKYFKKEGVEEIKDIINSLHKKNNIVKEDYKSKGKEIFKIMNKDENKIDKNEINNFFINYLFEKHKDKTKEEKIQYFKILKEINKYLDIEKTKKNLDVFFINDKENDIKIMNEEHLKLFFESLNENNYYSQIIEYLQKTLKN